MIEPMFCRKCRYNLKGSDSRRCPECSLEFDPNDPQSYATSDTVDHLETFLSLAFRPVVAILISMAFMWIVTHLWLGRSHDGIRIHPNRGRIMMNLKAGLMCWEIQRTSSPDRLDFDARSQHDCSLAHRSLSRAATERWVTWRFWGNPYLWATCLAYLLVMRRVLWRRFRRGTLVLSGILVFSLLMGMLQPRFVVDSWIRPDNYLDEFVFISGLDWNKVTDQTVIAYEKRAWHHGDHLVGFADGSVDWMARLDLEKDLVERGLALDQIRPASP